MCSGDSDLVSCPDPDQGLIILSANFASVTENYFFCPNISLAAKSEEGFQSDKQPGHGLFKSKSSEKMEKCVKSSVSSEVEKLCLGHSSCHLKADPGMLGAPQCENLNVFLKVTFACVHKKSLISSNKPTRGDKSIGIRTSQFPIIKTVIKEEEGKEKVVKEEKEVEKTTKINIEETTLLNIIFLDENSSTEERDNNNQLSHLSKLIKKTTHAPMQLLKEAENEKESFVDTTKNTDFASKPQISEPLSRMIISTEILTNGFFENGLLNVSVRINVKLLELIPRSHQKKKCEMLSLMIV